MQAEIADWDQRVDAVLKNSQKQMSEDHPEAGKYGRELAKETDPVGSKEVAVNEIADSLISVEHMDGATTAPWKDLLNVPWTDLVNLLTLRTKHLRPAEIPRMFYPEFQDMSDEPGGDGAKVTMRPRNHQNCIQDLSILQPQVGVIKEGSASVDLALSMYSVIQTGYRVLEFLVTENNRDHGGWHLATVGIDTGSVLGGATDLVVTSNGVAPPAIPYSGPNSSSNLGAAPLLKSQRDMSQEQHPFMFRNGVSL